MRFLLFTLSIEMYLQPSPVSRRACNSFTCISFRFSSCDMLSNRCLKSLNSLKKKKRRNEKLYSIHVLVGPSLDLLLRGYHVRASLGKFLRNRLFRLYLALQRALQVQKLHLVELLRPTISPVFIRHGSSASDATYSTGVLQELQFFRHFCS